MAAWRAVVPGACGPTPPPGPQQLGTFGRSHLRASQCKHCLYGIDQIIQSRAQVGAVYSVLKVFRFN